MAEQKIFDPVFSQRFCSFLLVVFLLSLAVSIVGLWQTATTVNYQSLVIPASATVATFVLGMIYRTRDRRFSELCLVTSCMVAVTNMFTVPMFLIGRLRPPFADQLLGSIDKWIGLEVPQILALRDRYPITFNLVSSCYDLLLPTMMVCLLTSTFLGHGRFVRQFVLALIISATIGFMLFYSFPAQGFFELYGITPDGYQIFYRDTIRSVWTSQQFEIDVGYRAGLIYFPSFHTILALLTLLVARSIFALLLIASIIAALIILSTLTTGSHYFCDIPAGIAVAALSCYLAVRLEPYLRDRHDTPTS